MQRQTPFNALVLCLIALFILVATPFAHAKDLVTSDSDVRTELLRRAIVWKAPSWISRDFKFDPAFDIAKGPDLKGDDRLLLEDEVYCQVTKDELEKPNGKTPKFSCRLMRKNSAGQLEYVTNSKGKAKKIKVKFTATDMDPKFKEVETELLATRLLWALGFGADTMVPIRKLYCYGCTENPFKNRKLDANTAIKPRLFRNVAVEVKLEGDEIKFKSRARTGGIEDRYRHDPPSEGFTLTELVNTRARKNEPLKDRQRAERDALRLLAVFLQNADLKAEIFDSLAPGTKATAVSVKVIQSLTCKIPVEHSVKEQRA